MELSLSGGRVGGQRRREWGKESLLSMSENTILHPTILCMLKLNWSYCV